MSVYYQDDTVTLLCGDSLEQSTALPDRSVDCIVTSPPYFGLRDYGNEGQYGLEETPAAYVETLRALFSELRRVLSDDGTLWLNIGDSYATNLGQGNAGPSSTLDGGTRPSFRRDGASVSPQRRRGKGTVPAKNLLGIPWRVAFALQDDGWILRNSIIWHKSNAMPESVTDRLSGRHENMFMFSKSQRYWFDLDPIRDKPLSASDERPQYRRAKEIAAERGITELHIAAMRSVGMSDAGKAKTTQGGSGRNTAEVQALADHAKAALGGYYREFLTTSGRNPGDVWTLATQPFSGAHFAVMPQELARRAIVAGCKSGGTVLDPFSGSGTTGLVAQQNGRKYVGIDISEEYLQLSLKTRLQNATLDFGGAA